MRITSLTHALLLINLALVLATDNSTNTTGTSSGNSTALGSCACKFDGNDKDDCVVYGTLDKKLKEWQLVGQSCLDAYNIKITAEDPSLICGSASSFVSALKSGGLSNSQVKLGLGEKYGFFWKESSTSNVPVLKDSITIDGTTYDCKTSASDCYNNAMKPYFGQDTTGKKEMKTVCDQLENKVRNARELEQSTLRVRLCNEHREGTAIETECTSMYNEMKADLETYSSMTCGGFGIGPGTKKLPGCGESSAPKLGGNLFLLRLAQVSVGYFILGLF